MKYTEEQIAQALESATWTFAKTMPWVPHYWTTVHAWNSDVPWNAVTRGIAEYGTWMIWGRKASKRYFDAGEWRYWFMDNSPEVVVLINRELISGSKAKPVQSET